MNPIGIMQGRLLPPIDGRIQCFPADGWAEEFDSAAEVGLETIEWIYELYNEDRNPLRSEETAGEITKAIAASGVRVVSVCADCCMEDPPVGPDGRPNDRCLTHLRGLLERAGGIGADCVVIPFVDSSSALQAGESNIVRALETLFDSIDRIGIELHLETDLPPKRLAQLMKDVGHDLVKVAYDTGNSASLGYDASEELAEWGACIGSVHLKDRVRGGGTVALGDGDTDFTTIFKGLRDLAYSGPIILQVARSEAGAELDWARQNRAYVLDRLKTDSDV